MRSVRRSRWCGTLVPALMLAFSVAPAEEGWLLRHDLEKGRSYRFTVTVDQQTDVDLGTLGVQRAETVLRVESTQTVRERSPDGSLTIDVFFDRISMEINAGGQSMSFDTDEPESESGSNPMFAMQRGLIGKVFGMDLSPQGEVRGVSGLDRILRAIEEGLPDDPGFRQTMEMVRQGFGEEAIKTMMQQAAVVFPDVPVKTGDTWSRELDVTHPVLGRLQVRSDYRVEGSEAQGSRDCVKLQVATTTQFGGESALLDQLGQLVGGQGAAVDFDWKLGEADGKGTVWIEKGTGLTARASMTQNLAVEMLFNITQGEETNAMKIRMGLVQRIDVERPEP